MDFCDTLVSRDKAFAAKVAPQGIGAVGAEN